MENLNNNLSSSLGSIILTKETKIFLVLLFGFICAGMIASKYHTVLSTIERDGTEFLFDAKRILNGQGYNSDFWPFGYMVTISVVNLFTKMDFFISAKLITLISAVGTTILTYLIGKELFSYKVALLAVVILVTNHLFLLHSFLVETDMYFTFFFLLSIYFLIKDNEWKNFMIAGSFSGIAYMIKYGIYAIFPVVIIISFISSLERGLTDGLKKVLIFVITFIIFSSPWLINNTIKNGSPFYSKHYLNIAWGMNRPIPMPKDFWQEYFRLNKEYTSMVDVVKDTMKFLKNWARNVKKLPEQIIRVLPLLGFFLFPAYLMAFNGLDRRKLIVIVVSFSFLSLVTMAYTWDRYLLPLIPIFSVFIAFCIYNILPYTFDLKKVIKGISVNLPLRNVIIITLILISFVKSFNVIQWFIQDQQIEEFKVAGQWLKDKLKKDDWLMVPEPQVAWYAGTDKFVKYPKDKTLRHEDAVKMREQTPFFFIQEGLSEKICTDINYFVYDKRWKAYHFPYKGASDEQIVPENFVRVFSTKGSKTEIIIYKILKI